MNCPARDCGWTSLRYLDSATRLRRSSGPRIQRKGVCQV
jgi:hypothetical protein